MAKSCTISRRPVPAEDNTAAHARIERLRQKNLITTELAYVMTFETGQIGVILRRMSDLRGNPVVFVGYVPGLPGLPEELDQKLVEMLRWDRILPGTNLPPRVRPQA